MGEGLDCGGLAIAAGNDFERAAPEASWSNASVAECERITPGLVRLLVRPDFPRKAIIPGHYVALGLPGGASPRGSIGGRQLPARGDRLIMRTYSVASGAEQDKELEFLFAVIPMGKLSGRLAVLRPGERVYLAEKSCGAFTLEGLKPGAGVILVATGTGVAPYMSMLRTPLTWEGASQVVLACGVRYREELVYHGELEDLSRKERRFAYYPVLSRPAADWLGLRGRVQSLFYGDAIRADPLSDHVYLCGNPAMIDEMQGLFAEKGFRLHGAGTPGNLHVERFWRAL